MQLLNKNPYHLSLPLLLMFMISVLPYRVHAAEHPSIQGRYSSTVIAALSQKRNTDTQSKQDIRVELNDDLTLKVLKLKQFRELAEKEKQNILLVIDGMLLKDSGGVSPRINEYDETITFSLTLARESIDVWKKLLGNSLLDWERSVKVSIGLENGLILPSSVTVKLVIIRKFGFILYVAFFIVVGLIFNKYARTSALLRVYGDTSPYSLASVQMAIWFFVILASYIFIWAVTGEYNAVPASILMLMGIAGGTKLGARVLDDNKKGTKEKQRNVLLEQRSKLQSQTLTPEIQQQIDQITTQIDELNNRLNATSQGFPNDILSDGDGISLHRLQIAVWTVVLGVVFCVKVIQSMTMPEFDNTLLALIGISSGTYLGLKLPE